MPTDVLERVRSEIKDRLAALSGAVSEAQQLEIALVALEEVSVDGRPAPDAGHGRRRPKGHTDFTVVKAAGAKAPLQAQTTRPCLTACKG